MAFYVDTELSEQTTKPLNPALGLTPTVNDVAEWKPGSIYYANVNSNQSCYGTGFGTSWHDIWTLELQTLSQVMELVQSYINFNIPHPSILLHMQDKPSRNTLLLLTQEVMKDIIYRLINLHPLHNKYQPHNKQHTSTPPYKGYASICSTLGLSNTPRPLKHYFNFKKLTLPDVTLNWISLLFTPFMPWQFIPILCQHHTAEKLPCTLS
jgi:hypothetical protein